MALGTGHWTESQAKRMLEACAKSGLSDAEFSRREGIRVRRLQWWRDRLGLRRSEKRAGSPKAASSSAVTKPTRQDAAPRTTFAPAVVRKGSRFLLGRGAAIVIETRAGARIEVVDVARVSPAWVAAVLRALERRR